MENRNSNLALRASLSDSDRRDQIAGHCFSRWLSMTPDERDAKITADGLIGFVDDAITELNIPIDNRSSTAIENVFDRFERLVNRVYDFNSLLNEFGYEIEIKPNI